MCVGLGLDLLVLFGSARRDPDSAHDIDLGYLVDHERHADELEIANAFGEAYGDALDLMPLHRADPVARYAALGGGEVLCERVPGTFAARQMAAFGAFCDTQRFRDAALERLAG
jgi:predicted nucleotidyltransferase